MIGARMGNIFLVLCGVFAAGLRRFRSVRSVSKRPNKISYMIIIVPSDSIRGIEGAGGKSSPARLRFQTAILQDYTISFILL